MIMLDFFPTPEALDLFLAEHMYKRGFRMTIKPALKIMTVFYAGKLQKTFQLLKKGE